MDKRSFSRIAIFPVVVGMVALTGCTKEEGGVSFPAAGAEVGAYTLKAMGQAGGSTGGGTGGFGGNVTVSLKEGVNGRVELLDHGKVDASFMAHTMTGDMGAKGETISTDTTINTATVATLPASGGFYISGLRVYKSDGDGLIAEPSELVSGITVAAGTKLTLGSSVTFQNDVINNGTITTTDTGAAKTTVSITARNYIGSSASKIDLAGYSTTVPNGGTISLSVASMIVNDGAVTTNGYTDTATAPTISGGNAGGINMTAVTGLYNTGALTAKGGGGNGTAGPANIAGSAGAVSLTSTYGGLNNSGAIDTSGGSADLTSTAAGNITLATNGLGDVRNTGNLTARGGGSKTDAATSNVTATVTLRSVGGDVKNSGDISVTGGSSALGFTGGQGGSITISSDSDNNNGRFEAQPGNVLVSGNLDVSGGSAAPGAGSVGGDGGSVTITGNTSAYRAAPQLVALWGYTEINVNGANGETGGDAGWVLVSTSTAANGNISATTGNGTTFDGRSSGNIVNGVKVSAISGDSISTTVTNRAGGNNTGGVTFTVDNATNVMSDSETVTNSAEIITSAGKNHERTGGVVASGPVVLEATGGVTNSGAITTTGGDDNDTTGVGRGNNAGGVTFSSIAGSISNTGAIRGVGGNGQNRGGAGGTVTMFGVGITNSANVLNDGGDATATVVGSIGGTAGNINFTAKTTASDTGVHSQTGGTGEVAGRDGYVKSLAVVR